MFVRGRLASLLLLLALAACGGGQDAAGGQGNKSGAGPKGPVAVVTATVAARETSDSVEALGTTRAAEKREKETRVNAGGSFARRLKMMAVVQSLCKINAECRKSDGKTCMQQIILQAVSMN